MGDNLRDIPEFIERELGESLQARTDALSMDLNPRNTLHGSSTMRGILHLTLVTLPSPFNCRHLQGIGRTGSLSYHQGEREAQREGGNAHWTG